MMKWTRVCLFPSLSRAFVAYNRIYEPSNTVRIQSRTRLLSHRQVFALFSTVTNDTAVYDSVLPNDGEYEQDISSQEPFEEESTLDLEIQAWQDALARSLEALSKKERSLQAQQAKSQQVDVIQHRATLLQSHLYLFTADITTATVTDWETNEETKLTLDSSKYDTAPDEVAALFAQVRKLQKGQERTEELLSTAAKARDELEELQTSLETCSTRDVDQFRMLQKKLQQHASFQAPQEDSKSKTTKTPFSKTPAALGTPASNVRKFTSDDGTTIYVGRNRKGNEFLSMTKSRPLDVWMHARGVPGAHVLIRTNLSRKDVNPLNVLSDDCLQLAANLAAFYSDGRSEAACPITVTLAKHLRKPKQAPTGAVTLTQELNSCMGRPDKVPVACHEQRAASGQDQAYRRRDKAVLRKSSRQRNATKKKKPKKQDATSSSSSSDSTSTSLPDFF